MNDFQLMLPYLAGFLASYFLGSIPFGFLIAKARGVDIRTLGSGNIGATNVFRSLGKGPGILTFALDFAKGLVSALVIAAVADRLFGPVGANLPCLRLVCGAGALVGHSFPVFLGFKGGKGVATGVGLVMGLSPASAGIGLAVWLVVFLVGRYVSLASIAAATSVAVAAWTVMTPDPRRIVPIVITILCALVIARHHANIGRLLKGTENRFSFGRRR